MTEVELLRELLREVLDAGDTDYYLGLTLKERILAALRGDFADDVLISVNGDET